MSETYHKIIVMHNGALGDFCCIFPALAALRRHFSTLPIRWAGSGGRKLWLDPLEITPATSEEQRAIRRLYAAEDWPQELQGALVPFFVLDKNPFSRGWPALWMIRGVDDSESSPRELAREQLLARNVPWPTDWQDHWADYFRRIYGTANPGQERNEVLLFPGAGHPAKQWPLVKYIELAAWLTAERLRPVFVLGPAEQERGLQPESLGACEVRRLQSMEELMAALANARAVCGNDCGPMHLAGLVRTPGLVLFGPTSRRQWAPPGLSTLACDLSCRPCSRTTRSFDCDNPVCLTELPVAAVTSALKEVLVSGEVRQHLWKP